MNSVGGGLYILFNKSDEFYNLHFDSKVSLLKVVSWIWLDKNKENIAPIVIEKAYYSKENEWNYTNFGPFTLESVKQSDPKMKDNFLFFYIKDKVSVKEFVATANKCIQSAGWDNTLLIPESFYG